jgi:hypothetical protein
MLTDVFPDSHLPQFKLSRILVISKSGEVCLSALTAPRIAVMTAWLNIAVIPI